MGIPEYDRFDALGMAGLVRRRDVSPEELLHEAILRRDALDPHLNAVVLRMDEEGRRTAGAAPEGPFRGVPFLLKDLLHAYAGYPLSSGSAALARWVPPGDSTFVQRLRRSGLVTFGKTNTPEFGLLAVTEPAAFGPTRNPWCPGRTPGGSSGGSAAAVAAGIVPIASANDGGGSIRIPASHCGLFGLKPSRGRVPAGPYFDEVWEGAVCDHVLTRSVRDSAAALDAVRGADRGARYVVAAPERPYREEVEREAGRLRIGFSVRSPIGGRVDPACVRAVEGAATLLGELGHHIEEAEPEIDGHALARCYLTMYFGQTAADVALARRLAPEGDARDGFEETTRALALLGRSLPSDAYVEARRKWNTFARAMGAFHDRYDLYLTPAAARPPVRVGELAPSGIELLVLRAARALRAGRLLLAGGIIDRMAAANMEPVPFTQLANITGQPAMSVPLHWTPDGLPVGAHFMAAYGREDLLFRVAWQLERARPWIDRRPPLSGRIFEA